MNTVPRNTARPSAGATRSVGGRRLRIDLRKVLYGALIFSVALGALRCRTSGRSEPMPASAAGHALYTAHCAACHGPTGTGDGLDKPTDENGRPIQVRDLTSGIFRGGVGAEELFKRMRCGVPGTPMPAQVTLDDEEIWQLIHYVRFLSGRR